MSPKSDLFVHAAKIAMRALEDFDFPKDIGVMMISSIAEGYGNPLSDIDILLVCDSTAHFLSTRHMTYVDEKRCEIFIFSESQIAEIGSRALAWSENEMIEYKDESKRDLQFYQRFCEGRVLRSSKCLERIRAKLKIDRIAEKLIEYDKVLLQDSARRLKFYEAIGDGERSLYYANIALKMGAHLYSSLNGQYNRSDKFLYSKLKRLALPPSTLRRLRTLMFYKPSHRMSDYLVSIEKLFRELAIYDYYRTTNLYVAASKDIKIVKAWGSTYVVSGDEVFIVKDEYVADLERMLNEKCIAIRESTDRDSMRLAKELFAYQLVNVACNDNGVICTPRSSSIRQNSNTVRVNWSGVEIIDVPDDYCILKLNVSAGLLARSGLNLALQGMYFATFREDAIGAIRNRAWEEVESGFRGMIDSMCKGLLLSQLKVVEAQLEPVHQHIDTDDQYKKLGDLIRDALECDVTSAASANLMYQKVDNLYSEFPQKLFGELENTTKSSMGLWITTQVLISWGAFALDVGEKALVLDEFNAEETIRQRTDGQLEPPHMYKSAVERTAIWSREEDVFAELEAELG